ncbi:MAG: AtpZ/AtpI family protein [Saprospiraceae bacterium]
MQEPSQQPEKNKSSERKPANDYLKYSGMAFQMGAVIAVFTYLGQWLDGKYATETPYWTVGFALLGVFLALYFLIKDVMKP